MTDYYIKRGDKIHGPYTWDQVNKGVDSGKLCETDLLSESTDGPWFPVVESVEYLGSEEAAEAPLTDTDGDDLWGQDLAEAVEQQATAVDSNIASFPEARPARKDGTPGLSVSDEAALSKYGDFSSAKAAVEIAKHWEERLGLLWRIYEFGTDFLDDGLQMVGRAVSIFKKYPVFLLPLIACWCIFAALILYIEFGATSSQVFASGGLTMVFILFCGLASILATSSLVLLELIRDVELGKKPRLLRAVYRAIRHHFVPAIPIIIIWAAAWMFVTLLSAIFSRRRKDREDREDRDLSMENAARTLAGGTPIFSFRYLFKLLNKAIRLFVFLILPGIVWLGCGPVSATKHGYSALMNHLRKFASGFILSEAVAILIGLPLMVFFQIVDGGGFEVPDIVWLGVIIYAAFGWSFATYVEQILAAELFLWHLKWDRENQRREALNLPPIRIDDLPRPDLLDDVNEFRKSDS